MAEILEAAMLVCFGCSWPINLVKNIKAKTAQGMSLKFILLIIVGYIAGITAKVITHRFNYVFVVYLLNLAVITVNLAVYFVNKNYDKKRVVEQSMDKQNRYDAQELEYIQMNKYAKENSVVLFGSNSFSSIPFNELANSLDFDSDIYNRSVNNKSIDEECSLVDLCVTNLSPSKVFINLGEYDLAKGDVDEEEFFSKYEWILYTINSSTNADIYIVSIPSLLPQAKRVNDKLKSLATEHGCKYVDITKAVGRNNMSVKVFDIMKRYMRKKPISFYDAMHTLSVS